MFGGDGNAALLGSATTKAQPALASRSSQGQIHRMGTIEATPPAKVRVCAACGAAQAIEVGDVVNLALEVYVCISEK
jgi:hypothetical protein